MCAKELLKAVKVGNALQVALVIVGTDRSEVSEALCHAFKGPTENPPIVSLLLSHGADVTARNDEGCTPLHLACEAGYTESVGILIDHGADVNILDGDNWTPLHFASNIGSLECVELLVKHGANVNAKRDDGCTPLHQAAAFGYTECVKVLLSNGANVGLTEGSNRTAYDLAREQKQFDVMRAMENSVTFTRIDPEFGGC